MLSYTQKLMKTVLNMLTTTESHCEVLGHIIKHVLSVISLKVKRDCSDEDVHLADADYKASLTKTVDMIDLWLHQKTVIGHMKFGGLKLKKFEEEVRVRIPIYFYHDFLLIHFTDICRFGEYFVGNQLAQIMSLDNTGL